WNHRQALNPKRPTVTLSGVFLCGNFFSPNTQHSAQAFQSTSSYAAYSQCLTQNAAFSDCSQSGKSLI
ncbi:hypothetical protein, partial [Cellvibrio zantedeschiae]|uniref:hypothetical protein n=1 Tax=Cellvibrio zantedeschiae TaxID=1237077 RepID=UPI001E42D160